VSSAYFLLLFFVAAGSFPFIFDALTASLLLTLSTALMIGVAAALLRSAEALHVWRTIRLLLPLVLVPAVWMLVQILPTPYLAHPIWQSAAAAFDTPPSGKITVDPGLTLQALVSYLTAVALALGVLCVTTDRRRAHLVLIALAAATGFITVAALAMPGLRSSLGLDAVFAAIANLGMLLSASLLVHVLDQYLLRRPGSKIGGAMIAELTGGIAVFLVCIVASLLDAPRFVFVAGLCGLVPVFLVAFLRHVSAHRWENMIVVAVTIAVAAIVVFNQFQKHSGDLTLRTATAALPAQTAAAQRMMSDAGPLGMGAGTYAALIPIYRGIDDPAAVFAAPTTAAAISIEMGRSGLVIAVLIGLVLAIVLFRRALGRGRDSLYAAAGSGCLIVLVLQMFADNSLRAPSVAVLCAAVLGLALGQSLSLPRN
jgi:hypothetical protein